MSTISFEQVFNQAYAQCNYNENIKTALHTLWQQGVATFETLYADQAQLVIQKCYEVSPRFCLHVVTVVYGIHWSFASPNDYDKALMTNVSLILDQNFNQFKVLLLTFLKSATQESLPGANILISALHYLFEKHLINPQTKIIAEKIITEQAKQIDLSLITLTARDVDIIQLSVLATLQQDINNLSDYFSKEQQLQLIFHANTYIGCPKVWDASITLQEL